MKEEETGNFTAYCGLFCRDCIPSNKRLFAVIRELRELASSLHLDEYAKIRSESDPALRDYATFARILAEIEALECPAPCRLGGGKEVCAIRDCARERGYEGCWECTERISCRALAPLRAFHGETIDGNLDAIAEFGVDDWMVRRGRHYPWV
jgi:Protein of unknown function (DUF3795)